MHFRLLILLILTSLLRVNNSYAQAPTVNWQKIYSGIEFKAIKPTSDNGFILIGDKNIGFSNYNVWVAKVDASGIVLWEKTLGGSRYDYGNDIVQTSDGGFILVGETLSNDENVSGNHREAYSEIWVAKLNSSGDIEWQKCLGGTNNDVGTSIVQAQDGSYYVGGFTYSNDGDVVGYHGNGYMDALLIKLDNSGNKVWSKCIGGTREDRIYSLTTTSDGNVAIACLAESTDGDVTGNHGSSDAWIVKFDNLGNIVWKKCYGGSDAESAKSIKASNDGGIIVGGYTMTINNGDVSGFLGYQDGWVIKTDKDGNLEWQKCVGGDKNDVVNSINQKDDGTYILCGETSSATGDLNGNHGGYRDAWIAKLDLSGSIQWQTLAGGSDYEYFNGIAYGNDGSLYTAGTTRSTDGDLSGNSTNGAWLVNLGGCKPSKPVINGLTSVCLGTQSYAIISKPGETYTWNVSGGGTITGSGSSATVNWATTGTYTITCTPSNSCGNGGTGSIIVNVNNLSPSISAISGTSSVCANSSKSYYVTYTPGITYTWSLTGGGALTSNSNSSTIINWTQAGNYVLTCTPSNGCGNGNSSTLSITVNPLPTVGDISGGLIDDTLCSGTASSFRVTNSIIGQKYRLKDNAGNDLSVLYDGNGGNLDINIASISTPGKYIYAINSSQTNTCGTTTKILKDSLLVLASPSTVSIIIKDTICVGETPILKIAKSLPDVKYRLTISGSPAGPYVKGNSDTLFFTGSPIIYDTYYGVQATNLKECYASAGTQKKIIADKVTPNFSFGSEANLINDTIKITNTSNGIKFNWTFDNSALIVPGQMKNPSILYNTTGEKIIKLVTENAHGCKDSISKKAVIFNPTPKGKYSKCFEKLFDGNYVVTDYHLDKLKNSYVTGYLDNQMFAFKADSIGNLIWLSKRTAYQRYSYGTGITSDSEGNTYVVGNYSGNYFNVGSIQLTSGTKNPNYFIIKFDTSGTEKWAFHGKLTSTWYTDFVLGADIICDNNNRLFASGYKSGNSVDFISTNDTKKLSFNESKNHFLLELNTNGGLENYIEFGRRIAEIYPSMNAAFRADGGDIGKSVGANPKLAFDNAGNIVLAGSFSSYDNLLFEIGSYSLNSNNSPSTYIARYSKSAGWISANKVVDGYPAYVQSICVDQDNAVYTTGSVQNTFTINEETEQLDVATYGYDPIKYTYITKSLPDGSISWYMNSKYAYIHDMVVSNNNSLIVTGSIQKRGGIYSASKEPFGMKSNGDLDIFISEYSPEGQVMTASNFGTSKMDMPYFIKKNECGDIYMCALENRNTYIGEPFLTYGEDYGKPNAEINTGNVIISKFAMDGFCVKQNCVAIAIDTLEFDAKIVSIFPDSVISTGNQNIETSIKNLGKKSISEAIINYQIDNLSPESITWNGAIAFGLSANIVLEDYNFTPGSHTIKVWLSKINGVEDENHANDTLSIQIFSCDAGLVGTYSIGKKNSDFNSFSMAIETLKHCGLNGPVVFNVADGIYEEQVYIPAILNASEQNTITFKSASEDSSMVILTTQNNKLTNNYLLKLSGADYFIFKQMTFKSECKSLESTIIELDNGSDNNKFINNQIIGLTTSLNKYKQTLLVSPVNSIPSDENEITGNLFINGEYGFLYSDKSSRNANKNIIQKNKFRDQNKIAISIVNQDNVLISDNDIETNNNQSDFTGIYISHSFSNNSFGKVLRNRVKYQGDFNATGISVNELARGILIANNYVRINSTASSINTFEGAISCIESDYIKLYFNSVVVKGTYSINCFSLKSSLYADVKNNNFVNLTMGRAFYIEDIYFAQDYIKGWDYNNLFTKGSIIGASKFLNLNSYPLFSDWVTATGFDNHSYSVNLEGLISDQGYIGVPELNGKGIFISEVLDDIQGQTRSISNPDIGADEFDLVLLDASIDSISYPYKTLCEGPQAIILRIGNSNSTMDLKNVAVNCKIGTDTIKYVYNGNIQSNSISEFINIGVYNFKNGSPVSIKYWLSLPNGSPDLNSNNDTIEKSYVVQTRSLNLPSNLTMCPGENVILDAGNGTEQIQWSTGEISRSISVSKVGYYSVLVKTNGGCIISDTVRVESPNPGFKQIVLGSAYNYVSVAIPDLNTDGFSDIAVSSISGSAWFNYVPDTKSFVGTGINNGYNSHTYASWADYDNNGDEDVLISTDNNINIIYNTGGQFVGQHVYDNFSGVLTCFDFNKDRYIDALINGRIFIGTQYGLTRTEVFYTEIDGACLPGDYDNDGDQDILTFGSTFLNIFKNNGSTLVDVTTETIGLNIPQGVLQTASWGDYNNDGWMDLFIGMEGRDYLYKSNGNGTFSRVFDSGEFKDDTKNAYCSSWGDFDNDGYIDLFVGNFIYTSNPNEFHPNTLYKNNKDGSFSIIKMPSIPLEISESWMSKGAAWGDIENDGDLDLVSSTLFFQNEGNCNNWINIKLVGTKSNRSAIGAKVYVYSEIAGKKEVQVREMLGLTGKFSQNSLVASFGLGDATKVDSIIVKWPSGIKTKLEDIGTNQKMTIPEEEMVTSIDEGINLTDQLLVYPNPGTGKYHIKLSKSNSQQISIEVFNITGKKEFQGTINSVDTNVLDLSSLASGVYFLRLVDGENTYIQKLIKN